MIMKQLKWSSQRKLVDCWTWLLFLLLPNLAHRQVFLFVQHVPFFSFMCQPGSFYFSIVDNLVHPMPFVELHHFLFSFSLWLSVGADLVNSCKEFQISNFSRIHDWFSDTLTDLVHELVLSCDVCFTITLVPLGNICYLYPVL